MSTTTSPAPVTPPPRVGSTPHVDEPERAARSRWSVPLRWTGDAVSLVLMVAFLWGLSGRDGGRGITEFLPVVSIALAYLPWAAIELRRVPRAGVCLIAGLAGGTIISVAFGTVRTGFEEIAIVFATTIAVGLAGHRIWQRDWAPPVLLILVLVSFGLYWQRSFLQWWGAAGSSGSRWLALSWHNQSGTLMAAFGVFGLAAAITGRRLLAGVGLLMAGGGFAGAWLSASRGALLASLLGVGVALAVGIRERGSARTGAMSILAIAATVAVVGWLTFVRTDVESSQPSDGSAHSELSQPLLEREGNASTNASLRLRHIEAALGMFADRPLTGQGLGSYRAVALRWSAPEANLTSYAHNRYAQALGEGGLALGVPLIGLLAGSCLLFWRRMYRRPTVDPEGAGMTSGWRRALSGGFAAMGTLIAAHSMIDFDWTFPVLPMLLAVAAGTSAFDQARGTRGAGAGMRAVTVGLLCMVMIIGLAAHGLAITGSVDVETSPEELARDFRPWQAGRGVTIALQLSERGEHELARSTIERVASWSPGLLGLATERAVIDYRAGRATPEDVASTLKIGEDWFGTFNLAGDALLEAGDHHSARAILQRAIDAHSRFDPWDRGQNEAESYVMLVRSYGLDGDCQTARSVAGDAPDLSLYGLEERLADELASLCP